MMHRSQQGNALIIILAVFGVFAALAALSGLETIRQKLGLQDDTTRVLAQAKEALLGRAAIHADSHAGLHGFLPCPDTTNDGVADACGGSDVTVVGRLPWKTLGLPDLRDGAGECLWYVVSGRAKEGQTSAVLNWDSPGQLAIQDAAGQVLAAAAGHDTPWAAIVAPGGALAGQDRTPAGNPQCGGNATPAAYLDGLALSATAGADSTLTVATPASVEAGTNNDRALWITGREVYERVKKRPAFAADIGALLNDLKTTLDAAATPLSTAYAGYFSGCSASTADFRCHWRDNLRLAEATGITVNGVACSAVLLFSGERTTGQSRLTVAQRADKGNYLEAPNLAPYPGAGAYSGGSAFDKSSPAGDLARCIVSGGTPPGTTITFNENFTDFLTAGSGVTTDPVNETVTLATASGSRGGCLWHDQALPLRGKTLRGYYRFQFTQADPSGGADRGYGFTLSFLRGDMGEPDSGTCGQEQDMGMLADGSDWGDVSLVVETDVHRNGGHHDPSGNHTAIMANGDPEHKEDNGETTSACDGSAEGCQHSPAYAFEESPQPVAHEQRVEIHTGCDGACGTCGGGGGYARIRVWVDCTDSACRDLTEDVLIPPQASRCFRLKDEMESIYFGFTAGFGSGANAQGVILSDFHLSVE